MPDFTMPSLGADMDRGTLTEWLVGPGDRVNRGDAVAVVETDKAEIEVECFDDGVIDALLVEPGTSVPVGAPLARLTSPEAPAAPPEPSAPEPVSGEPAPAPAPAPEPRHAATPLVRRLAEEQGVDVASVHGTGHDGRVVRADVERAARPPSRPKASPMARRIAGELGVDLGRVRGSGPAAPSGPTTSAPPRGRRGRPRVRGARRRPRVPRRRAGRPRCGGRSASSWPGANARSRTTTSAPPST
ncbi:E3 binding domain-containing protein [Actinomadura luteofluorescens]|uniref:E3 binding domain-containing protein n=1 Tax=Actinomadura luteofluorescens TaxID=46163 RepID=UPI003627BAB5